MAQTQSSSGTLEDGVTSALKSVRETATRKMESYESSVREDPTSSILWAAAVGYVLRILPITALFAFVLRLLLALLKPAALIFGAYKLYQLVQQNVADQQENDQGR